MRVCVFCGSNDGFDPAYREAATALGRTLARNGIGIVYGGGNVGLMGTVADAALAEGGDVIGVIPRALADKEVAHRGLTELRIVASMHERKALMSDLADGGYIALPGGAGTLEELFEVWTWGQLGYHGKPIGLLDVANFYGGLLGFLDHAAERGFMRREHRDMLLVGDAPDDLIRRMRAYEAPKLSKWIRSNER